jgi:predicted dehydrogenase
MRVVIVGTGHIAEHYAHTLAANEVDLVACHDIDRQRALDFSRRWSSAAVFDIAEFCDYAADVAVNLTPPLEHATISKKLLMLNIPVYSEKPLAHELIAGHNLVQTSDDRKVALMCAPDVLLSPLHRKLRESVDSGLIGQPLFVSGQIAWSGHERWHPRARHFYLVGGGPLLDLGPYWIAAMVNLVGPVRAVTAIGSPLTVVRALASRHGKHTEIVPEIPTTTALLIEFRSGVIGSLALSFDWPCTAAPAFEIVGEGGSLVCDTPLFNGNGVLHYRKRSTISWSELSVTHPTVPWPRGIGVVKLLTDRFRSAPWLSKALALHVLDTIDAAARSIVAGKRIMVTTSCPRPA